MRLIQAKAVNQQAGTVPLRVNKKGEIEVCVITTNHAGKWGIPKGSVKGSDTLRETALRETWEESGCKGISSKQPLTSFNYRKASNGSRQEVAVFFLFVTREDFTYPESDTRKKKWVPLNTAFKLVPRIRFILAQYSARDFIRSCQTKESTT
jgi:8-oxo-dGTP pyrophosphatase MutT (NUDIX family)